MGQYQPSGCCCSLKLKEEENITQNNKNNPSFLFTRPEKARPRLNKENEKMIILKNGFIQEDD